MARQPATLAEDGDSSVGSRWCEGYTLLDPLGQKLGRVERILRNGGGETQYVRIRPGFFG